MAKDLFADNEANEGEEDNDEDLVPTPPPKPLSKKPRSLDDMSTTEIDTSPKKQDLLLNSNLLKSNSTLIKSPIMVDVMSNKCDRYGRNSFNIHLLYAQLSNLVRKKGCLPRVYVPFFRKFRYW